jgi:hypothetical protein
MGRPPRHRSRETSGAKLKTTEDSFIVCGFPATYDDPTKEAIIAYPIGSEELIKSFLEARKKSLQPIMKTPFV